MKKYSFILGFALLFSSCGKNFLNEKRDGKQVIPASIADYQALMDRFAYINGAAAISLGLVGADEYNLPDDVITTWKTMMPYEVNGHLWEEEIFDSKESTDWNNSYHRILYANLALEVQKIQPKPHEQDAWNNAKGTALFFRGYSFYQLAQLFCKPYDPQTSKTDLGVPLKTSHDVTEKLPRASVEEVYQRILADLEEAYTLVPVQQINVFRPGKAAVAALLARTYLQMANFEKAGHYANEGLKSRNSLIDFNSLDFTKSETFANDYGVSNPEILLFTSINKPSTAYTGFNASPQALAAYDEKDLRKQAYFKTTAAGLVDFKGSYAGGYNSFAGLTTSELWLMRAETRARQGDAAGALDDLNTLRKNRFTPDDFQEITGKSAQEALKLVIEERRREFYFRGIRWEDLRRLNREAAFQTTLTRPSTLATYELRPGDNRWVFPLPDNEVKLNGYQQNPR